MLDLGMIDWVGWFVYMWKIHLDFIPEHVIPPSPPSKTDQWI